MMVDNTYHAGTVRDVAAMNAASNTGYTMTNAATNATADAQLSVHDFLSGLAQLRDTLDNTNEDNSSQSTDTVWLLCTCCVSVLHLACFRCVPYALVCGACLLCFKTCTGRHGETVLA